MAAARKPGKFSSGVNVDYLMATVDAVMANPALAKFNQSTRVGADAFVRPASPASVSQTQYEISQEEI